MKITDVTELLSVSEKFIKIIYNIILILHQIITCFLLQLLIEISIKASKESPLRRQNTLFNSEKLNGLMDSSGGVLFETRN